MRVLEGGMRVCEGWTSLAIDRIRLATKIISLAIDRISLASNTIPSLTKYFTK
jgi:hypothetical protein